MKWFKFYGQDYLSDPKMLALTGSERSCWITLLCYSSVNDNGMITFLSEEQLMIQAGVGLTSEEWDKTKGVLEKFKKLKMIRIDNGEITLENWQKRQETNLTSYERVKRHREKKRNDNAMITLDKNRIDKNRIIKKVIISDKTETHHKEIVEIINAFKDINPEYSSWYKNKTQRNAALRLLETRGMQTVIKVIEILPKTNTIPFLPVITTPYKLAMKWSDLQAGMIKKKNEIISKGRGLA